MDTYRVTITEFVFYVLGETIILRAVGLSRQSVVTAPTTDECEVIQFSTWKNEAGDIVIIQPQITLHFQVLESCMSSGRSA